MSIVTIGTELSVTYLRSSNQPTSCFSPTQCGDPVVVTILLSDICRRFQRWSRKSLSWGCVLSLWLGQLPGCDGTSTDREKHLAQNFMADLCTVRLANEKILSCLYHKFWRKNQIVKCNY